MGRITTGFPVTQVEIHDDGTYGTDTRADTVIVEEPLEIRVNGMSLTTTMRTPGHDIELAHGFLFSEGLIASKEDISTARYCAGTTPDGVNTYNVLDIDMPHGLPEETADTAGAAQPIALGADIPTIDALKRCTLTTSACGVCGTASIEQLTKRLPFAFTPQAFNPAALVKLPAVARKQQVAFRKTGGSHAASLFLPTDNGGFDLHLLREDVGRHNALDKVIGSLLLEDALPARDALIVMSSRASFELVQKALMAGIPGLVAVGAPTSLAVELARSEGFFLAGFTKPDRLNVYSGELSSTA